MSSNSAAVNPAIAAAAPVRPSAVEPVRQSAAGDKRFDRQLDAARQQGDAKSAQEKKTADHDAPSPAQAPAPAGTAKPHSQSKAAEPAVAAAHAHDQAPDQATNPVALAAAVLALIGQAASASVASPPSLAPTQRVTGMSGDTATRVASLDPAALPSIDGADIGNGLAPDSKAISAMPTGELGFATLLPPESRKDDAALIAQAAGAQTAALAGLPTAPVAGPMHALDVASPVGTPAFAQELGQHIAWLGGQDIRQARIRLHPEELGALDVKVSVLHDRVDVSFAVQHPAAVHALQQTLPQLDTLLAQHGLALGHADVGQRQQYGEARRGDGQSIAGEADGELAAVAPAPVAALGLLDTFA